MRIENVRIRYPVSALVHTFLVEEETALMNRITMLEDALKDAKEQLEAIRKEKALYAIKSEKDLAQYYKGEDLRNPAIAADIIPEVYTQQYSLYDKVAFILEEQGKPVSTAFVVNKIMERDRIPMKNRRATVKRISEILNRDTRIEKHGEKKKSTYTLKK